MKNIINNRMVSIYVYSKKPSLYSVQGRQGMEKVDFSEKTRASRACGHLQLFIYLWHDISVFLQIIL